MSLLKARHFFSRRYSCLIDVSQEVLSSLNQKKPVVALESTIITHGMPSPHNYNTAVEVENIIREQGAVPATVAVIDGRIKVGLDKEMLSFLADPSLKKVKISRRDFPYALSKQLNGGTTVSGTIMVAKAVGINIFVTGGIGGVHRNGENTLDISADLNELGMNCILTVCSGVKSILDIEKTLEYLETEGVCVACYGPSRTFPAFYSNDSRYTAPYHVENSLEAAKLLKKAIDFQMSSGILLGVPIPSEFSIDYENMEAHIKLALSKAEKEHKHGKEVTPFVLEELVNITQGKSLEANIALIKNNALVGAKIAKEYSKLHSPQKTFGVPKQEKSPVVIGGSNLDSVISLKDDIMMDGRTVSGQIGQTAGGVGRNIADALGKLHRSTPLLMSAVGSDLYGQFILDNVKHLNSIAVEIKEGFRTACYTTLIDKKGETRFGIGDMEIHDTINKEQVFKYQKHIENSSLLVMDGNIPEATIHFALEVANKSNIPVWYEPTDLSKADKPFKSTLWHLLSFITPNLAELKAIAKYLGNELEEDFSLNNIQKLLEQIKYLVTPLAKEIPVIMVTMGEHGVLMVSHVKENEPVLNGFKKGDNKVYIRYYKPIKIKDVQNTSGAGDCTASGFISGALSGLSEPECVRIGLEAALDSLKSKKPVPDHFSVNSNCLHDFPSFTRI